MKKTENMKVLRIFVMIFSFCLFLFNSCGLEEYIVLVEPNVTLSTPDENTLYDNKFFKFITTGKNVQPKEFEGNAVYYKIYNNSSTMNSEQASINNLRTSTNESASADKMIESYGYKQLIVVDEDGSNAEPLIICEDNAQTVYIRLSNYQDGLSESGQVVIGNSEISKISTGEKYKRKLPRRVGGKLTFDFGRNSSKFPDYENNAVPTQEDEIYMGDVKYSSEFSDDDKKCWYVSLYAVSIGEDENFTQYYSKVLHLGSVKIDSSLEDN